MTSGPEMTLLELSLPQKIKSLMTECKERQDLKVSFHQSDSVVDLEKDGLCFRNERRELGEEDETQLSPPADTGREGTSHPGCREAGGTAFQRHRSGFQGERGDAPVPRLTPILAPASFPSVHGAERLQRRKRPRGFAAGREKQGSCIQYSCC